MIITILSEDGTYILLKCTDQITEKMTGTELIMYLQKTLAKYYPERMKSPMRFNVDIELRLKENS